MQDQPDKDARTDEVDGNRGMPQEVVDTPQNEPGSQAPPSGDAVEGSD